MTEREHAQKASDLAAQLARVPYGPDRDKVLEEQKAHALAAIAKALTRVDLDLPA